MTDVSGDPVILPYGRMQPVAAGLGITLWAFTTTETIGTVLLPAFLGAHAGGLAVGDQLLFRCGEGCGEGRDVVAGTLAVLETVEAATNRPALVHTALIASTLAAGSPVAVAARARAAAA